MLFCWGDGLEITGSTLLVALIENGDADVTRHAFMAQPGRGGGHLAACRLWADTAGNSCVQSATASAGTRCNVVSY